MPKKKYSINWENDQPSSFEVDGVAYESLDQVPDEGDRSRLDAMLNASTDQKFEKEFEEFDREFEKEFEAHKKTPPMQRNSSSGFLALLLVSCW